MIQNIISELKRIEEEDKNYFDYYLLKIYYKCYCEYKFSFCESYNIRKHKFKIRIPDLKISGILVFSDLDLIEMQKLVNIRQERFEILIKYDDKYFFQKPMEPQPKPKQKPKIDDDFQLDI